MDNAQIIAGFLKLLRQSDFDNNNKALKDLPQLGRNLDLYRDNEFETIADTIVDWCAEYKPLGDELIKVANALKFDSPEPADPTEEQRIQTNIMEINIKEIKQEIKKHTTKPTSEKPEIKEKKSDNQE